MTTKDYEALAALVEKYKFTKWVLQSYFIDELCDLLERENPSFDRVEFKDKAGIAG